MTPEERLRSLRRRWLWDEVTTWATGMYLFWLFIGQLIFALILGLLGHTEGLLKFPIDPMDFLLGVIVGIPFLLVLFFYLRDLRAGRRHGLDQICRNFFGHVVGMTWMSLTLFIHLLPTWIVLFG